jgi:pimeloyl-ACP methyl ester carboxylesterase
MALTPDNFTSPAQWYADYIKPAMDDLIAQPLALHRGYAALTAVYHFHERIFWYLVACGKLTDKDESKFADIMRQHCGYFDRLTEIANPSKHHLVGHSQGAYTTASTVVSQQDNILITSLSNRPLLPLLDEMLNIYRKLLAEYRLPTWHKPGDGAYFRYVN